MLVFLAIAIQVVGCSSETDIHHQDHEHRALQSLEMILQQKKYRQGNKVNTMVRKRKQRLQEVLPDDMDAWAYMKGRNASLDGPFSHLRKRKQHQQQEQISDISLQSALTIDPSIFTTLFNRKEISNANGIVAVSEAKSRCERRFSHRRFYNENEQRNPPVLYTFPGAGNTWCRLLIEYATGIYTGKHTKTMTNQAQQSINLCA